MYLYFAEIVQILLIFILQTQSCLFAVDVEGAVACCSVILMVLFTLSEVCLFRSDVSSSAVLDARLKASQVTKNLCHENKCTVKLANHGVPSSVVELSFSESPANGEISTSQSWSDLYRRAFCKIQAEFSCTFEVKSTSYSNKGKKEFYSGLR